MSGVEAVGKEESKNGPEILEKTRPDSEIAEARPGCPAQDYRRFFGEGVLKDYGVKSSFFEGEI